MIICCGEVLIDMVPAGIAGRTDGFMPLPGGSPYNTAIAIGRMGAPVAFLGRFSNDFFGEMLLKRLRENKVRDSLIVRSDQNSTLAFVKLEKGKNPQYVFYAEGTADRSLEISDLPKKLPAGTSCICFGSISMTMEPVATAIETLVLRENALQAQGKSPPVISFDPNIRPFMIKDREGYISRMEKWICESTITKISAEDFNFLYPGQGPENSLQKILAMGPRLAICTMGAKGAIAMLRRNDGTITRVEAPIVDLPVVDTIGAGDSFHGAFLSRLELNGKMSRAGLATLSETELYDALFFANKAASLVCTRHGAEPPTFREVESLKPKKAAGKAKPPAKAARTAKPAPATKKAAGKAAPPAKAAHTTKPAPAAKKAAEKAAATVKATRTAKPAAATKKAAGKAAAAVKAVRTTKPAAAAKKAAGKAAPPVKAARTAKQTAAAKKAADKAAPPAKAARTAKPAPATKKTARKATTTAKAVAVSKTRSKK